MTTSVLQVPYPKKWLLTLSAASATSPYRDGHFSPKMLLLKLIQKFPFAPPIFSDATLDKFAEKVVIPPTTFPTRTCPIV